MSISFQPMGTNRPARKIWIDREYGVPLRTEIYDLNGNLALLSMFSEIQFAPALDNETFNPQFPKDIIPKNITESRYADIPEAQDEITDFKLHSPTYLPEGFTLIGISRLKVGKSERIQLLYSDGLSSLSVFEDKPTVSPSGNSLPAREVLINDKKGVLYDQGLLKILDWNLEDIHVTLVAEISEDELLKVAGSIVP
jgi:negative regulator of sigma E activity